MAWIRGIDHIAFPVADLEASTAFFDRLFGIEVLSEHCDGGRLLIRRIAIGGAVLSLHQDGNGITLVAKNAAVGCADVCLAWDGTLDEAMAQLAAQEIGIVFGPRAMKSAAGRSARSVYFRDPDGNLIELMAEDESNGSGPGDG